MFSRLTISAAVAIAIMLGGRVDAQGVVMEAGDDVRQRRGRIHHGTTVAPRVQVRRRAFDVDLQV